MAAGLGFKTFTTGEVLTAADVNGYLMQGILVFANAAARTSAITSPQEGQYSFLKDTNALEYYDGAAWVGAPVGDITAVTAGTGISGGGSSGAVTITNDMATTITASGDIVVGTGSGTYDNLPIGTTGQVLTADTTVSPYKVKWATPASPTFVGCAVYFNSSSLSFTANIAQTFTFTTEDFDTDNFHSNSTNTSRITIPSGKAGKYLFNVNTRTSGGMDYALVRLLKNGSQVGLGLEGGELGRTSNMGSNTSGLGYSIVLDAAVSDYFEMQVQISTTLTANTWARFSATYLGA